MPTRRRGGHVASSAPIAASDGWSVYTADHLALIDHLGFEHVHIMGGCIGSSYCLGLCQAAHQRVSAAVLQNPIGLSADNRANFLGMFDSWAGELQSRRPDVDAASLAGFRESMFGGDFCRTIRPGCSGESIGVRPPLSRNRC